MLELHTKLAEKRMHHRGVIAGEIRLPFDLRQKTRLRTHLVSGEEVALLLPRGEVLRGGDLLAAEDGRVIEVVAAHESVLHITCPTPQALTRAAYHLGNRHVPVQVGEGFLRIAADHVLAAMLAGLGATLVTIEAAFEPESGAYGAAAAHSHHDGRSGPGRIHEYGHGHSHDHSHGDGHDHHHHRDHEHS